MRSSLADHDLAEVAGIGASSQDAPASIPASVFPSIPASIPAFATAAPAARADAALRRCLAVRDRAQHGAVLWFADILARGLFRDLGFSSMNQYAQEKLGFSRARTSDFMALARKLDRLPTVREELAAGRLGYTKAREIVAVADARTEQAWLHEAQTSSRRHLELKVKAARRQAHRARRSDPRQGELVPTPPSGPPAALPVRVGFELTTAQHARYEALLARLHGRGSHAELLLDALEALVAEERSPRPNADSPRGESDAHVQIHVHDCPRCRRAVVATPRGECELSETERAMAYEDALVHEPGQPNRSTIPPRVRREVLARDRHTCRRRGCGHTRELHLHHVVSRAVGGTNTAGNLVTLCGACHRLLHEKGMDLTGMLSDVHEAAGSTDAADAAGSAEASGVPGSAGPNGARGTMEPPGPT